MRLSAHLTHHAPRLRRLGSLHLCAGSTLIAPSLTTIVGCLTIDEGATLDAPALAHVGGEIALAEGATIGAPLLSCFEV